MSEDLEPMKLSRRTALGLVASGLGAVVLAACAPSSPSPSATVSTSSSGSSAPATGATAPAGGATAPAAAAAATPQPKSGGTLRIADQVDVNRLDPHFRLGDVYYSVYDRLTQYDQNHNVQPMLAESWDVSPDYMQIKFNLRQGVQFHNGADFDAAAVKFNSERARDLPNTQLEEAKWWTSIDTPDKYTVIFKSDKPRPLAFDFFEFLNIAEPTSANDPTKAVGTGPFKFVEWKQNDSLTLVKNPNYWLSGRPYLDGINMAVITDPQARTTRFEGGSLDAVIGLSVTDFVRLQNDPNYVPHLNPQGNFSCFGVNCQVPPWDNKQVREALLYAVDRQRWATQIMHDLEFQSSLPWTQSSPAYDETKGKAYAFDLAKAKSMLQAAGVTSFTGDVIMPNNNAEQTAFAQVLQSDFAQIGITLNLKPQDQAAYLDVVNNWKYSGFWLGGGSFAQLDPGTSFTKSRALSVTGNSSAFTAPANAAAVELVGRATTETDPDKRKQIYSDLNDMLLGEVYIVGLSPTMSRLMSTNKVQGISPTLHSAQKWWEVYLA